MSPETAPVRPVPEGLLIRQGGHKSFEEGVCIMEAVAWIAGEPFSDAPVCACPVIRRFAININDRIDDDALRTRLLLPLVPQLVGSTSTPHAADAAAWRASSAAAEGSGKTYQTLLMEARAHLRPIRERQWASAADCIARMLRVTPETTEAQLAALAVVPTPVPTRDPSVA